MHADQADVGGSSRCGQVHTDPKGSDPRFPCLIPVYLRSSVADQLCRAGLTSADYQRRPPPPPPPPPKPPRPPPPPPPPRPPRPPPKPPPPSRGSRGLASLTVRSRPLRLVPLRAAMAARACSSLV